MYIKQIAVNIVFKLLQVQILANLSSNTGIFKSSDHLEELTSGFIDLADSPAPVS